MSSWASAGHAQRTKPARQVTDLLPMNVSHPSPNNKKLKTITYATPTCTDTAVILAFFNPANSIRIQQNLLYVLQQLRRAKISVFVGEVYFGDNTPLFSESESTFLFHSDSFMFYKENIFQQVISKPIVRDFSKYVMLDADVIFETVDWLDRVSLALEQYDVLQPFENVFRLNKSFVQDDSKECICKVPQWGHTGFAWAFRRDWLERIGGLFEYALTGSGDTALAYCVGLKDEVHEVYRPDLMRRATRVGFLSGDLYHLPHGKTSNRQHVTRILNLERIVKKYEIRKLSQMTERNDDGILEWKKEYKMEMNELLLKYFQDREDDGLD